MSTTRLADVVIPEVYATYQAVDSVEKADFITSGVMVSSPTLNEKAASGGVDITIPFWKDLDTAEPNVSNDDPTSFATPRKIQTGTQRASIALLNNSWEAASIVKDLAGSDPIQRIRNLSESYWKKQLQYRALATVVGVMNSNVAAGGNMVYDVSKDVAGAPTAAEMFSQENFLNALGTMGDALDDIGAIAMHSAVYMSLVKQNLIDFVKPSDSTVSVPYYMGKVVIKNDSMPVIAGANRLKYVSVMFGNGALGFGQATPDREVEYVRSGLAGNGGGVDTIITRKTWLIHPFGFKFDNTGVAGGFASLTELKQAGRWSQVFDERKQIPLVYLVTNG